MPLMRQMTPLEEAQAALDEFVEQRRIAREHLTREEFRAWNIETLQEQKVVQARVEALTSHGQGQVVSVSALGETNRAI